MEGQVYLLLDTNIFIDYINSEDDKSYFNPIIEKINDKKIHLLVTDILVEEWVSQKEKTIKSISDQVKQLNSISKNDPANELNKKKLKTARERSETLDAIIAVCPPINTPQKIKAEVVDRRRQKKAPFHDGKTKTDCDALIYLTTVNHLKRKRIKGFIFITKDTKDFSAPHNKSMLHPDLIDPDVITYYFSTFHHCAEKYPDLFQSERLEKDLPYQITLFKRGKKDLLTHLYDVIKSYREKITFIPTSVLARIEPFRVSDSNYSFSYYSGTNLITNNAELFQLFQEVDIKNLRFKKGSDYKNSKDNKEKLKYILTCLNENLVYKISLTPGVKTVLIYKPSESTPGDPYIDLFKLSFSKLLKSIKSYSDPLKVAFILFELGRFNESLEIYYSLYEKAIKKNNKAAIYRLALILSWVSQYAEYQPVEIQSREIIEKCKSISLENIFLQCIHGDKLDLEIVLKLKSDSLIDTYKLSIQKAKAAIEKHYQLQLNGGASNNNNLNNLDIEFVNFQMFTLYNGMAYTKYTDFQYACDLFIEGVFMCLALNEYQPNRLKELDDNWLTKFLFYGTADKMIRYFHRYLKKDIRYISKKKEFLAIVGNFLNMDDSFIEQYKSEPLSSESSSIYRFFWNICLLLSIVDFEKKFIIDCFPKLYKFLTHLPQGQTHQLHHLASLIQTHHKTIGKKQTEQLYKFIIAHPQLHKDPLFSSLAVVNGSRFRLHFTSSEFQNIISLFLEKCEKCQTYHRNTLIEIFPVLSSRQQKEFSEKTMQNLMAGFDKELYYMSVMSDIIDYKPLFNRYLDTFPQKSQYRESPFSLDGEIKNRQLSDLMNLVFKTNAQLPKEFKDRFIGLSDYYDWVLDMKNFNYQKFNPLWILQYATTHYLKRIFTIEKVNDAVRSHLRDNHQPQLAYLYTQYVL